MARAAIINNIENTREIRVQKKKEEKKKFAAGNDFSIIAYLRCVYKDSIWIFVCAPNISKRRFTRPYITVHHIMYLKRSDVSLNAILLFRRLVLLYCRIKREP